MLVNSNSTEKQDRTWADLRLLPIKVQQQWLLKLIWIGSRETNLVSLQQQSNGRITNMQRSNLTTKLQVLLSWLQLFSTTISVRVLQQPQTTLVLTWEAKSSCSLVPSLFKVTILKINGLVLGSIQTSHRWMQLEKKLNSQVLQSSKMLNYSIWGSSTTNMLLWCLRIQREIQLEKSAQLKD